MHIPAHLPTLSRGALTLRAAEQQDIPALEAMLAEPEVARWWPAEPDVRSGVRSDLAEQPGWSLLIDGTVAGWLLVDEERDEEWRHVAFDIALSATGRGHGHGRTALRLAIAHFIARGHHRFTIDPEVTNARAIRAYHEVGFRDMGPARRAYRAADGPGATGCSWIC